MALTQIGCNTSKIDFSSMFVNDRQPIFLSVFSCSFKVHCLNVILASFDPVLPGNDSNTEMKHEPEGRPAHGLQRRI